MKFGTKEGIETHASPDWEVLALFREDCGTCMLFETHQMCILHSPVSHSFGMKLWNDQSI